MVVLLELHAAQAAGQLERWEQSLALLDSLIKESPESSLVAEAYFERGRAKQELDQLDAAVADFQQASERSRGPVGARAQFMVGEVYFQKKEFDQAIKDFQRVMFRVAADGAEIRNWQAKAGYEAARCCEVQIQNAQSAADKAQRIADAKKFYRYVVDEHPQHELAVQAKKRLEELAKL
jgi:tetratricopeptide (TPR) repeat protein